MSADVVILVEDPGAANMAAPLPAALGRRGMTARLVATGPAARHLADLGVHHEASADGLLTGALPASVVVGTSEDRGALGPRLIARARALGLRTAGLVDGPMNAALRFRGLGQDPFGFAPDLILVTDENTARTYADLGFPSARIVAVGHPHRDRARAERRRLDAEGRAAVRRRVVAEAPDGRPILVLLAEVSDGLDPAEFRRSSAYTLDGRGTSDARTDIVIEEVLDAAATLVSRPWIVLRPHPKNRPGEFEQFRPEVARLGRNEPLFDLLFAADLVVGLTSIALDEAALLGRPTLSVVPRAAEAAWLASACAGITPVACERSELRAELGRLFASPGPDVAVLDRAFPPGAAERAAEALMSLIAQPTRT